MKAKRGETRREGLEEGGLEEGGLEEGGLEEGGPRGSKYKGTSSFEQRCVPKKFV